MMNDAAQKNKTFFHYNSDMSGDVIVVRNGVELNIPGEALLVFVAEHARRQKIVALEDANYAEAPGGSKMSMHLDGYAIVPREHYEQCLAIVKMAKDFCEVFLAKHTGP